MLTSKAILFMQKGKVGFGEVLLDTNLGGDDLLLETQVSLVSTGTEMRVLNKGYAGVDYPFVPGYSAVCKVVEKGPGASGLAVGDLVFVPGGSRIAAGAASLWGCHSQYQVNSAGQVSKLSGKLPAEEYAFGKVASIALHGVRLSGIEPSEKVVVLGLGLIGQFTVRCLLARGADVIACDTNPKRLETIAKHGVATLNPSVDDLSKRIRSIWPEGPDTVFEVTARKDMVQAAASLLRERSYNGLEKPPKLVLQANYTESIEFGARTLFLNETVVYNPRDVQPGDFEGAVRMIESGVIPVTDLYLGTVQPEQAEEAYQKLADLPGDYYTMIFDWRNN